MVLINLYLYVLWERDKLLYGVLRQPIVSNYQLLSRAFNRGLHVLFIERYESSSWRAVWYPMAMTAGAIEHLQIYSGSAERGQLP